MIYKGIEIYSKDIVDVSIRKGHVLLSPKKKYAKLASNLNHKSIKFHILINNVDDESMSRFKFEHIRNLKEMPNPLDRVAEFEVEDENGITDLKKFNRMVELRKTKDEKQADIDYLIELIEFCIKEEIECEDLKQSLKIKMLGG